VQLYQNKMTPKDKAKQLTNKYFKDSDMLFDELGWAQAKECAKIAIAEILDIDDLALETFNYYMEVSNEIERL
jgi:hypothetical protein